MLCVLLRLMIQVVVTVSCEDTILLSVASFPRPEMLGRAGRYTTVVGLFGRHSVMRIVIICNNSKLISLKLAPGAWCM